MPQDKERDLWHDDLKQDSLFSKALWRKHEYCSYTLASHFIGFINCLLKKISNQPVTYRHVYAVKSICFKMSIRMRMKSNYGNQS